VNAGEVAVASERRFMLSLSSLRRRFSALLACLRMAGVVDDVRKGGMDMALALLVLGLLAGSGFVICAGDGTPEVN